MRYVGVMVSSLVVSVSLCSLTAEARDACAAVGSTQKAGVTLPFTLVDGRIYVEARVNDSGPLRFAVDTGASGVGRLDESALAKLGLTASGQGASSDGVTTNEVRTVHLRSLQLGALTRNDVEVITRDYKSRMSSQAAFDGILGREFFADGLLVIDYAKHQLSFSRAAALSRDDTYVLGYSRAFRVPVVIDGKTYEGNIDTGANVAMVVPKASWADVSSEPLMSAGSGQLTNGKIDTLRGVLPGPVGVSAITLTHVEARVSDKFPEILIGAHALQGSVLMIDQRTSSLAVCPGKS